MSPAARQSVVIISDQSENHRSYVAYVSRLLEVHSAHASPSVRHAYVELKTFNQQRVQAIKQKLREYLRSEQVRAVLGFYDAESTSEAVWSRKLERGSMLEKTLNTSLPAPVCIVVMNPMTESAFLLSDETTEVVRRVLKDRIQPRRLAGVLRERRSGRWVNRDALKHALGSLGAKKKHDLDKAVADVLSEKLPPCEAPSYKNAEARIIGVLKQAELC
ncbi:MAG: hypothetical protein EA397_01065 [Deltaproteobacteria bacterium]|nr:MAG: hypothetical protein EA397_01065 [Deltaproteobacteria bacterium]